MLKERVLARPEELVPQSERHSTLNEEPDPGEKLRVMFIIYNEVYF